MLNCIHDIHFSIFIAGRFRVMKVKIFISGLFILLSVRMLQAQPMRSDTLPLFEVLHNRLPSSNPGLRETSINQLDPFFRQGLSLGDILSRTGYLFIRINSYGALASPSLRGMGAAHTALIWNGFNLQSSMNGQADLNLVSPLLFDQFTLQAGAGAALWGSNAAGGTLHIGTRDTAGYISAGQIAGSWNNRSTFVRACAMRNKMILSVRAFTQQAENNYTYRDPSLHDRPLKRQSNAGYEQQALSTTLRFQPGKKHYFSFAAWMQEGKRQFPPLVTIPAGVSGQFDNILRASVSWTAQAGAAELQVRSGYFREKIHYRDSLLDLYAQNTAHSLVQEAEISVPVSQRIRLQAGINHTRNMAIADGYNSLMKVQQRAAGFFTLRSNWFNGRLQALFALRQEWFDGNMAPVTPSVSASLKLNRSFLLRGQVAGTFRIPTLNDLYWMPGGNPNLKPEKGQATELSVEYSFSKDLFLFSWSAGAFHNRIDDRILWEPGTYYWTPSNIGRVNCMGLESRLEMNLRQNKHLFRLQLNLQQVRTGVVNDGAGVFTFPENQLVYTPQWLGAGLIEFKRKLIGFFLQGSYTGARYFSSDNSHRLPGFILADAGVSIGLPTGIQQSNLFFSVRNLFNTAYEVVAWRPMPLRSWHAGIQFNFHKQ